MFPIRILALLLLLLAAPANLRAAAFGELGTEVFKGGPAPVLAPDLHYFDLRRRPSEPILGEKALASLALIFENFAFGDENPRDGKVEIASLINGKLVRRSATTYASKKYPGVFALAFQNANGTSYLLFRDDWEHIQATMLSPGAIRKWAPTAPEMIALRDRVTSMSFKRDAFAAYVVRSHRDLDALLGIVAGLPQSYFAEYALRPIKDHPSPKLAALGRTPSQGPMAGLPKLYADYVDKLLRHESFGLSERNGPFLAGLAETLGTRCNLPGKADDRRTIQDFVLKTSVGSVLDAYPTGGALTAAKQQLAGQKLAKSLGCGTRSTRLMGGILKVVRTERSADTFVTGCALRYTPKQCNCLAGVFSMTVPNIRRASFSTRTMREIIDGNPLMAIAVGLTCQVYEY